jgi:hypothetical protein
VSYYEQSFATVAAAAGAAYASIQGATTTDAEVLEVGAFTTAATASSILWGRPANTPVSTSPVVFNALNPDVAPAAVAATASAWSTAPTTPTVSFRRVVLPANIGAGYVAVWADGQGVQLSKNAGSTQWLIFWNFGGAAGSILAAYARERE